MLLAGLCFLHLFGDVLIDTDRDTNTHTRAQKTTPSGGATPAQLVRRGNLRVVGGWWFRAPRLRVMAKPPTARGSFRCADGNAYLETSC